jgi:hypothetical protein
VPGQRPKSNVRTQERWDLENAAYEGAIRKQRRGVMSGSLLPDEVRGEIEGSYEEGEGRDKAIKRAVAKQSLSSVHGLYIPGDFNANPTQVASADSTTKVADQRLNQPRDAKSREERATRDEYEQLLIREARNRGMPTMAICGGSWGVFWKPSEARLKLSLAILTSVETTGTAIWAG